MVVTYNTMVVNFNLTTQGVGGSISQSQAGSSHLAGSTVTLTAVADPGYRFIGWSGGLSGSANPATVLMDNDKTITANFIQQFTLTTNAGIGGSISAGGIYDAGTQVTVTPSAASGYRFGTWSGDAAGTNAPLSIVMDGNKTVTANFIQQFTLTTMAGTGGSISGGGIYDAGAIVNVVASAASGYRFGAWSGDLSGTSSSTTLVMNGDKAVAASFIQQFALITSAGTGGSISGGGIYDAGSIAIVTATPASGYRFGSWGGDLAGTTTPATVVMGGAKSVSASFVKTYTLTSSVVGGTITLDPAGGTYDSGTSVTITATPGSPELSFLRWTGDLEGQPNGVTITMTDDFTFAVEFLGSLNLTTPGTSTWTVPAGVTRVTLSAWGGGGAGGSASASRSGTTSTSARGGGGAGGGFARTTFRVAPASPVAFTIGQGGTAPATVTTNNSSSEAGGDTSATFNNVAVVTAKGGLGGKNALVSNGVSNVGGGTAPTSHVGTLVFNGGNGANGSPNGTGGGGGSAGSTGSGGTTTTSAGGVGGTGPAGETGAVGGAGHNGIGAGSAGGTPGAGGSGAAVRLYSNAPLSHRVGGSGANGRMIVTYIVSAITPEPEVALPALAISVIGSQLEVRWPLSYPNWLLEESHTLGEAAVWIEIPAPYASDAAGFFWQTSDLSAASSFYRLSKP